MMTILRLGMSGSEVYDLQSKLQERGFYFETPNGVFDYATDSAVKNFQHESGLTVDGVAGTNTQKALGMSPVSDWPSPYPPTPPHPLGTINIGIVQQMFPNTPIGNLQLYIPFVLDGLKRQNLVDKPMTLMALATIRAETESCRPISEGISKYNTEPNGRPFGKYDLRTDLGNNGIGEGERFKGRGFVQLTGRYNYEHYGNIIRQDLVNNPELANNPTIAAELLAAFLKEKEGKIRTALSNNDLMTARKLVNGGTHGIERFMDAYNIGNALL
jgi:putative chitinase